MNLSKVLTAVIAVSCITAFGSLGSEFRNAIVGISNVNVGSASLAAEGNLGLPGVDGLMEAGNGLDGFTDGFNSAGVTAAEPALGEEGSILGSMQGAEGSADATGLQPGQYSGPTGDGNPSGMANLAEGMQGKLDGVFTLDNFGGPLLAAVGGVASTIIGTIIPSTIGGGMAGAGFFGGLAKVATIIGTGALLIPAKALLIVGGAVLAVGAVGWGIYKVVKHLWPDMQGMAAGLTTRDEVGSSQQPAIGEPATTLPTEEELAAELDTDGDGVSLEDEIAAEDPVVTAPDLDVDLGSDESETAEPEAPAPKTAAEQFAHALMGGSDSEARDKLAQLLLAADSKSAEAIEMQASEILNFLSENDYQGNASVQQWTEEAVLLGYDPRLLLALVAQSRTGDYSTTILNDFGGAWNALSDDGEIYDIIDQLGSCGGGASCVSSLANTAHTFVNGDAPRLGANPEANASEMANELIEAIESYLSGDAIALHTAESIRPLLDAYPR